mgnify:CR=1 FL=1
MSFISLLHWNRHEYRLGETSLSHSRTGRKGRETRSRVRKAVFETIKR